jgi:GntR family transcriptional repressor for pyruvate dehydrogenase complex
MRRKAARLSLDTSGRTSNDMATIGFSGVPLPRKLGDNLARIILDKIFRGEFAAGDRLPSIEELGHQYGMSVVSVREAIQKLAIMGLVHVRQGGGTFLDKNIPSILEILDARKYVEMATSLLAARNATAEDHALLGRLIAKMEEDFVRRDFVSYTRKDLEFHLAIGRMSKNVLLSAFLENIQELLFYLQERTHRFQGTIEKAYRFHPEIAEAIRKRDGYAAQALIMEHIEAVKRAWGEYDRRSEGRPKGGKRPRGLRKATSTN